MGFSMKFETRNELRQDRDIQEEQYGGSLQIHGLLSVPL